ncbi:TetR-like C-terminal domain-containing protein [Nakamurella sp. GG22]
MAYRNLSRPIVVLSAADLADRDGLEAVTVSAVARLVEVQPASLYSHVRGHAGLLDGIHELALAELAEAIADAIAGRAERDALIALTDAQRDFARMRPGRWAALQRPAAAATVASSGAARVSSLTLAVLRGYGLPDGELVHAARFMGAVVNGFLNLERIGAFLHSSPEAELSWRRLQGALDVALRRWPTPTEHGVDR